MVSNSVFKTEMVKDIDEAGKPIKKEGNKKSKKKLKIYFLNIKKLSNKMVTTLKK